MHVKDISLYLLSLSAALIRAQIESRLEKLVVVVPCRYVVLEVSLRLVHGLLEPQLQVLYVRGFRDTLRLLEDLLLQLVEPLVHFLLLIGHLLPQLDALAALTMTIGGDVVRVDVGQVLGAADLRVRESLVLLPIVDGVERGVILAGYDLVLEVFVALKKLLHDHFGNHQPLLQLFLRDQL